MSGESGKSTIPTRLLRLCLDLNLIDNFHVENGRIAIRQGMQTRTYSPAEAEAFIDEMLAAAPTLKQIASGYPRFHSGVERHRNYES